MCQILALSLAVQPATSCQWLERVEGRFLPPASHRVWCHMTFSPTLAFQSAGSSTMVRGITFPWGPLCLQPAAAATCWVDTVSPKGCRAQFKRSTNADKSRNAKGRGGRCRPKFLSNASRPHRTVLSTTGGRGFACLAILSKYWVSTKLMMLGSPTVAVATLSGGAMAMQSVGNVPCPEVGTGDCGSVSLLQRSLHIKAMVSLVGNVHPAKRGTCSRSSRSEVHSERPASPTCLILGRGMHCRTVRPP